MATAVTRVAVPVTANTAFDLASAKDRSAIWIYNDTGGDLFVKVGAGPSTTSFTVKLGAGGYHELDASYFIDDPITAVCSVITGAVQVTEVTS